MPLVVAGVLLASGCQSPASTGASGTAAAPEPPGGSGLVVGDAASPIPAAGTCHLGADAGQPVPDPACTPGAINPDVTQANIAETICRSGWTATVRPPTSVTNKIKRRIDQAYGLSTDTAGELDHEVSLELGGAPSDPRNLWVEPGKIPNPKDAVENRLSAAVCSGLIPLGVAQRAIVTDWVTALATVGLTASGKVCLAADPTRCAGKKGGDND